MPITSSGRSRKILRSIMRADFRAASRGCQDSPLLYRAPAWPRGAVATVLHQPILGDSVRIVSDRVVSIDYTIRLKGGQMGETSVGSEPITYLHGRRQIVPGVEQAIEGLESGAVLEIVVPPEKAYGERDPEGVFLVPREAFPPGEQVAPGMMFSASRPDGKSLTC